MIMIDLYTCGKGQENPESPEARSLCLTIHSAIINSED